MLGTMLWLFPLDDQDNPEIGYYYSPFTQTRKERHCFFFFF